MARRVAFRRKKNISPGIILILASVVLFMTTVLVSVNRDAAKLKALREKKVQLEIQIQEQEKYSEELKQFSKYTKTKKYAEEVAKDKLGLVYSDEIVFRPDEN